MAYIPYAEQLLDPRWQKKRLEVLTKDDFTCQFCGDTKTTLHVHHFCYEKGKMAWESDLSALITICAYCHSLEHKKIYYTELEKELLVLIKLCVQLAQGKDTTANYIAQQANNLVKSIKQQNG